MGQQHPNFCFVKPFVIFVKFVVVDADKAIPHFIMSLKIKGLHMCSWSFISEISQLQEACYAVGYPGLFPRGIEQEAPDQTSWGPSNEEGM